MFVSEPLEVPPLLPPPLDPVPWEEPLELVPWSSPDSPVEGEDALEHDAPEAMMRSPRAEADKRSSRTRTVLSTTLVRYPRTMRGLWTVTGS
jgi:hypothetical protein